MAHVGHPSHTAPSDGVVVAIRRLIKVKRRCWKGVEHVTKSGVSCGHSAWLWALHGHSGIATYFAIALPRLRYMPFPAWRGDLSEPATCIHVTLPVMRRGWAWHFACSGAQSCPSW